MKWSEMREGVIVRRRGDYAPLLIVGVNIFGDYRIAHNLDAWNHVRVEKSECQLYRRIGHIGWKKGAMLVTWDQEEESRE